MLRRWVLGLLVLPLLAGCGVSSANGATPAALVATPPPAESVTQGLVRQVAAACGMTQTQVTDEMANVEQEFLANGPAPMATPQVESMLGSIRDTHNTTGLDCRTGFARYFTLYTHRVVGPTAPVDTPAGAAAPTTTATIDPTVVAQVATLTAKRAAAAATCGLTPQGIAYDVITS